MISETLAYLAGRSSRGRRSPVSPKFSETVDKEHGVRVLMLTIPRRFPGLNAEEAEALEYGISWMRYAFKHAQARLQNKPPVFPPGEMK